MHILVDAHHSAQRDWGDESCESCQMGQTSVHAWRRGYELLLENRE